MESTARGHLAAVDVIRFLTVGGVIAVHSTSLVQGDPTVAGGVVLQLLHVTRSVFLMLSAFVLTLSFDRRPLQSRAFWRRRFPLVAAPYVVWSVIYFVVGGGRSPTTLTVDLLDGGAHFHLYFLLLTMQLYVIFPALMWLVGRFPQLLRAGLVVALAWQLGFTAAVHYGWRPAGLGVWFSHPGSWLPSYALYVLGGIAAARHFDAVTAWVEAHSRLIVTAVAATAALGLASYFLDMHMLGMAPVAASSVFQPAGVLEAVAVTVAEFAAGLWVAARASEWRLRFLERTSDVSFGVFLAHPLLVSAILWAAAEGGIDRSLAHTPGALVEVLVVVGLVPFTYAVTYAAMLLVRRTPATLWLTGRRVPLSRLVPAPAASGAPAPA